MSLAESLGVPRTRAVLGCQDLKTHDGVQGVDPIQDPNVWALDHVQGFGSLFPDSDESSLG